jgi:hypothetical protein
MDASLALGSVQQRTVVATSQLMKMPVVLRHFIIRPPEHFLA